MNLLVRCACGQTIECQQLDVVESLNCPACQRELRLEFEGPRKDRRRAILAVIEGPSLVDQRFVIPVGEELLIGSGEGCWLCLASEDVAPDHCSIKTDRHGVTTVRNLGSSQGTWIGTQRIVEGLLEPGNTLHIGFYSIRLDHVGVDDLAAQMKIATVQDADLPGARPLPVMKPVDADETPATLLVANRYRLVRAALITLAWCSAAYHFFAIPLMQPEQVWYVAPSVAVLTVIGLHAIAEKVALANPRWNWTAMTALAMAAAGDGYLALPYPAAAAILIGIGVAVMVFKTPDDMSALMATILGAAGLLTIALPTLAVLRDRLMVLAPW